MFEQSGAKQGKGRVKLKPQRKRQYVRMKDRKKEKKGPLKIYKSFLKAARYVRGAGAGRVHPRGKITLFGLMMQAQKGDCPNAEAPATAPSRESVLDRLKREAWMSHKGKKQEAAMREYITVITELAPQWKLSNLVVNRAKVNTGPRRMIWILKIGFTRPKEKTEGSAKPRKGADALAFAKSTAIKATSFEVMQWSNEAMISKDWFGGATEAPKVESETGGAAEQAKGPSKAESTSLEDQLDNSQVSSRKGAKVSRSSFIESLPRSAFTEDDLLVDVGRGLGRFKTIKEQNDHFVQEMQQMARENHDEEDGWSLVATIQPDGIDVYERSVAWSDQTQLRSRWDAARGVRNMASVLCLPVRGGLGALYKQVQDAFKHGNENAKQVTAKAFYAVSVKS